MCQYRVIHYVPMSSEVPLPNALVELLNNIKKIINIITILLKSLHGLPIQQRICFKIWLTVYELWPASLILKSVLIPQTLYNKTVMSAFLWPCLKLFLAHGRFSFWFKSLSIMFDHFISFCSQLKVYFFKLLVHLKS